MYGIRLAIVVAAVVNSTVLFADDWPQWTGPRRDSTWTENGIVSKFPQGGPKVLWRTPIAGGYSGPAVANGRVYVSDFVKLEGEAKNDPGAKPLLKGEERIHCLDQTTGKILWSHKYATTYEISYPAGPRATPTVDGELVFVLGASGNLTCLSTANGKPVWEINLPKQYKAPTPTWGFVSHPLVYKDLLFCLAGGEGSIAIAVEKSTGKERWRALSATDAGYCPPTMIEVGGKPQLAIWHPGSVNGLDPETGKLLWSVKLVADFGMSINPPRQSGDKLFVGGIYDKAMLLKVGETGAEELWSATRQIGIGPAHSPPFMDGDVMYGVDRNGELTAVELKSGKRLWQSFAATTGKRNASSGTAFIVKNGDKYYIFAETGELVIAQLTPEKYSELDRAKILEPTHEAFGRSVLWSHPAYANRCIFARNDKEIICVSLAAELCRTPIR